TVIGASPTNAEGTFEATVGTAVALVPNLLIWGILIPWTLTWHRIRLQNLIERVAVRGAALNAEETHAFEYRIHVVGTGRDRHHHRRAGDQHYDAHPRRRERSAPPRRVRALDR